MIALSGVMSSRSIAGLIVVYIAALGAWAAGLIKVGTPKFIGATLAISGAIVAVVTAVALVILRRHKVRSRGRMIVGALAMALAISVFSVGAVLLFREENRGYTERMTKVCSNQDAYLFPLICDRTNPNWPNEPPGGWRPQLCNTPAMATRSEYVALCS